ncbi:MAG: sterol desaturase family protein [Bacteroidia bacterium]
MKILFGKLCNFQFREFKPSRTWFLTALIITIAIGYPVFEVLFMNTHFGNMHFSIPDLIGYRNCTTTLPPGNPSLAPYFTRLWLGLALLCVVIRFTVITASYFLSKKALGEIAFKKYFYTYFLSFIIATAAGLLLLALLAAISSLAGFSIADGKHFFEQAALNIYQFIDTRIPALFNIRNYWLALPLTILLTALPGWFTHWLCHKSRFCWYVFHRPHHTPQFLHPLASPPAFVFDFVLLIPQTIVAAAISKIIYTQPLLMEMSLWFLAGYCLEIFNHSAIHYNFAYRNFFVRNLSRLFGDVGVYHLMHHSAKPSDEIINLGGGTLQLWDRIFRTYRKPYSQLPQLGLTSQPAINMNPLRILFSGIAQIAWELKMNKSFTARLKILFGNVDYKPALSREFLIEGY